MESSRFLAVAAVTTTALGIAAICWYLQKEDSLVVKVEDFPLEEKSETNLPKIKMIPNITKKNYICSPSIELLSKLSEEELASIESFSIQKVNDKNEYVAKIKWIGKVDLRGLDLDAIVNIADDGEIAMYENSKKPAFNTELNASAIISLYKIPCSEGEDQSVKLREKLAKCCASYSYVQDLDYDADENVWRISVSRFC